MTASTLERRASIPHAPQPRPVQSLRFLRDPIPYFAQLSAQHGPVFQVRIAGIGDLVVVTRPDLVQRVLTEHTAFEAYHADEVLAPLIGSDGILLLTGEEHLRRRKLLLPHFHGARLARWTDVISETAARELDGLARERVVEIRPTMARITTEVICRLVFGVEDRDRLDRLIDVTRRWTSPRASLPLLVPPLRVDLGPRSPWGALQRARAELRGLIDEAIADATRRPGADVLSMLLAATDEDGNPGYTHDELHDELLSLLHAGHDTTASALAWSAVLLADNPDAWRRLVTETEDGGHAFADAIGRETLRLRPSTIGAGRRALHDTELDGHPISAGAAVLAFPLSGHDAASFPDPAAFRPERWLADEQPSSYASTPFGGGVHRCVGAALQALESRLVLQELARSAHHLTPAPGRRDGHTSVSVVLVPSRGGRVIVGPPGPRGRQPCRA